LIHFGVIGTYEYRDLGCSVDRNCVTTDCWCFPGHVCCSRRLEHPEGGPRDWRLLKL